MKNKLLISVFIILTAFTVFKGFAQESFFNNSSALSIGGKINTGSRYFLKPATFKDINIKNTDDLKTFLNNIPLYPYIEDTVNLKYSGNNVHAFISLKNNLADLTDHADLTGEFNEAYIHLFLSPLDLLAGYAKVVWGKGDGIHVIDRLNADDYRDFINRDYLDRRVAEPMVKLGLTAGETGYFEFAYEPVFTPDIYPESGIWFPAQASTLQGQVTSAVEKLVQDTYTSTYDDTYSTTYQSVLTAGGTMDQAQYTATQAAQLAASAAAQTLQDEGHYILPDTNTLLYSQLAGRYTFSVSGLDLVFSDYYGFLSDPVIDTSKLTTEGTVSLSYDRVNTFGLEASAVALGFNTWMEAAYNLTSDYNGDDPMVHNNSIQYLAGFDRDLPIHNLYINIQLIGSYIINNGKINAGDIEYKSDELYTKNIIAWSLSDTFFNDVLKLQFDGSYNFEHKDYMLRPKADFAFTDDLHLAVLYTYFQGDSNTNFGQFRDNSFAELNLIYRF